jgi:hypothetical protein
MNGNVKTVKDASESKIYSGSSHKIKARMEFEVLMCDDSALTSFALKRKKEKHFCNSTNRKIASSTTTMTNCCSQKIEL